MKKNDEIRSSRYQVKGVRTRKPRHSVLLGFQYINLGSFCNYLVRTLRVGTLMMSDCTRIGPDLVTCCRHCVRISICGFRNLIVYTAHCAFIGGAFYRAHQGLFCIPDRIRISIRK